MKSLSFAVPPSKATLVALKGDPGLILRRIKSRNAEYNLSLLKEKTDKALAEISIREEK